MTILLCSHQDTLIASRSDLQELVRVKKNTLWADTTVSRSILVAAAAGAGFAMAVSVGG